ncbi:ribonuclease Z [Tunicatimonas pelagia]|uniref:ribonuclease Z n=1 Tax=Tunicatimonas pelagia TaxID=931531 RepID=UPI00266631F8|nr:ribonuclease Z [Tunicatimonas pelagia]WKN41588.1 ribonuclease Z [Tunicatimonas pelagia]
MSFQLKILGSNSATPAFGRYPTSQLLTVGSHYFLIDCGEGCQMQLSRYRARTNRISQIFISHLHGDHYFGLIGLLNTLSLVGRKNSLTLYGPPGLNDVLTAHFRVSQAVLGFPVHFVELRATEPTVIYENAQLSVTTFPVQHRIACWGFLFREQPKPRRINKDTMPADLSVEDIIALKNGQDVVNTDGSIRYQNEKFTLPPRKSRSYAYCADTRYFETLAEWVSEVDLLYHETTFMDQERELAEQRYHSTTLQAAEVAKQAKVETLLIGHFSSRYRDLSPLLEEAKTVFSNTSLAIEGQDFTIPE